jgi:hypothetical protein
MKKFDKISLDSEERHGFNSLSPDREFPKMDVFKPKPQFEYKYA